MCDTCGIDPEFTGSGIGLFNKNSDREADEAQLETADSLTCNGNEPILRPHERKWRSNRKETEDL